jgi:hypothetical protein
MDAAFSMKTFSRRLERAYMRAHRRDRNTVLGFLIAQTLLAFFVAYVLDRFTGFPAPVRLAVTGGILGGVLGWQLFRNMNVLRRKKDPESMARDVERRAKGIRPGGLYSMLVSATEFGVLGRTPGSEELRQRVLSQAEEAEYDPTKLELHRREDAVRTRKWLLAALAVYLLWTVLGPASMAVFFARAVGLPAAYPTRTRIVSVEAPETVARFQDITFTVTGSGELPAQGSVEIQYDGSKRFDLALEPVADSPGVYAAVLERPQRNVEYQVKLGDAESQSRTLRVVTPPVVGSGTLTVYPPEYTDLSPRTRPLGSVELWEGGRFDLEIKVAEKAERAELMLGDRVLAMEPTADGFRISSVTAESTVPYSVRLVGENGVENPRRAEFRLTVRKDEAPQVTLLSPDEGASVAPRSVLRWAFKASDDLGLTTARLQAKLIRPEVLGAEGEVLKEAETLATNEVDLADLQGASDLELDGSLVAESLGAEPGTRMELRVRVSDRYPQRDPQEGWSNPVTLQVVAGQKLKEILAEELMGAHLMIQDIRDDMKRQREAVKIRQDMTSRTGDDL